MKLHHEVIGSGSPVVHLVGASMGGGAAIELALDRPDRVSSLVLVASALPGYEYSDAESLARWEEIEEALEAGDLPRAAGLEADLWVADPEVRGVVREMILRTHRSVAMEELEELEEQPDPPAIGRLAEIGVPTLVVSGGSDLPDVRRTADLLANGISGAAQVVITGAGHLPSMERPKEFTDALFGFLGQL